MKGTMSKAVTVVLLSFAATGLFEAAFSAAGLSDNYYESSCPQATTIVAAMGCDASVLIVKSDHTAEMDAFPNKNSLGGFEFIDTVKAALEVVCQRTVSCADIVALAVRDAVTSLAAVSGQIGNFTWDVPLGRKDGNISLASETDSLPDPSQGFSTLLRLFAAQGLNESQMVVLSGAHTIGVVACRFVTTRFDDPTFNGTFKAYLEQECPGNFSEPLHRIALKDMTESKLSTNRTFDNYYYKNLQAGKGVFASDAALLTNSSAASLVSFYANSRNANQFVLDFGSAMVAMGAIGVLTEGHVRTICSDPDS